MHTKPMADSAGTFGSPEKEKYKCRKCGEQSVECRIWESSCGGYEDYKYECKNQDCKYYWWIEGIDS